MQYVQLSPSKGGNSYVVNPKDCFTMPSYLERKTARLNRPFYTFTADKDSDMIHISSISLREPHPPKFPPPPSLVDQSFTYQQPDDPGVTSTERTLPPQHKPVERAVDDHTHFQPIQHTISAVRNLDAFTPSLPLHRRGIDTHTAQETGAAAVVGDMSAPACYVSPSLSRRSSAFSRSGREEGLSQGALSHPHPDSERGREGVTISSPVPMSTASESVLRSLMGITVTDPKMAAETILRRMKRTKLGSSESIAEPSQPPQPSPAANRQQHQEALMERLLSAGLDETM